jgi:hypothetical protein
MQSPLRELPATLVTRRSLRRELPLLLGGAALALVWPLMVPALLGPVLAVVQVVWGLGLLFFAQRIARPLPPEPVTLRLGAGQLDIVGKGFRKRIRGRTLRGASASRVSGRVGIALQERSPVLLEVERSAQAKEVLTALGVGHDGFGELRWATGKEHPLQRMRVALRVVGALLLLPWLCLLAEPFLGLAMLQYVGVVAALVIAARRSTGGSYVHLIAHGLHVAWPPASIPYAALRGVAVNGDFGMQRLELGAVGAQEPLRVTLNVSAQDGLVRSEETAHMVAQIHDAARRAHGEAAERPEVAFQVADLARGSADLRSWLERVDRLAHGMRHGGEGAYRGRELDHEDLWAAVESPDAATDVRVAAARILGQTSPEARARILDAGKAARDPAIEKRLRIATEPERDAAAVVEALAELEAASPPGRARIA